MLLRAHARKSPASGCFVDGTATGGSVRASAAERRVVGDNEGLWWCVRGLRGRSVFVSLVEDVGVMRGSGISAWDANSAPRSRRCLGRYGGIVVVLGGRVVAIDN